MNILSKNTCQLLLATLLCLHFLAVPAMGEEGGTRKKPSQHQLEKEGRPEGRERSAIRSEKRERLQQDGGRESRRFTQDRQRGAERQDRVRARTRTEEQRGANREFKNPGRTVKHSAHNAVKPPEGIKQPGVHVEPATRGRIAKRPDSNQDGRAARSRQESALRNGSWPSHRSDAPVDGVRRSHFEPRGHGQSKEHFRQVRHDRRPVVVKHVIHKIPERHTVVVHGKDRYHYHLGRFYRPWNNGFILARPPLGLIVLNIPLGSRMFLSAGITYHVFGDIYYRRVPAGYQVVEPIHRPAPGWPDRVEVIIDLLNIRYGPENGEEVIAQVERHSTLRVLGSAPGWLYVEVEGEDLRGWVMERYVASGNALG